jgi:phage FluMu protein Com
MRELPEHRCPACNRLLYKGVVMEVHVKCPRCGALVCFTLLDMKQRIVEYGKKGGACR